MAHALTVTHHVMQGGCDHSFTITPADVAVRHVRQTHYSVHCQNPRCGKSFDITIDAAFASAVSAAYQQAR